MKIRMISVGQKMPKWVTEGVKEYQQRLPKDCQLELVEVAMAQRTKNTVVDQAKAKEAAAINAAIPDGAWIVALEVKGKAWTTEQLAENLSHWREQSPTVCLLIGGPDGLDVSLSQRANARWSLSPLTLPHPLVRVVLSEQIYRAWSITQGHPYHRGQ